MPARFLHLRSDGDGIRLGDDALKLKNVGTTSGGYEKRTHGLTRKSLFSLEPAKRLELLAC